MSSHHAPARWLIPNLIAEHSVNLIAGTSTTGKTSLSLAMLDDWLSLRPVLDYPLLESSSPPRLGALVLDRPVRHLQRAITDLGCNALGSPQSFPITELAPDILQHAQRLTTGDSASAMGILRATRTALSSPAPPRLLYIEAIDALILANVTSAQIVRKFLFECHQFCQEWDCTILATIGASKQKIGEGYACPIDLIADSRAWGSGVETAIVLTYPEASFRNTSAGSLIRKYYLRVPGCADRWGYMRMDSQGRLGIISPEDVSTGVARAESLLSTRLSQEPDGREFVRDVFVGWGEEYDLSLRTVERWIRSAIELGLLVKLGSTVNARYQKPVTQ